MAEKNSCYAVLVSGATEISLSIKDDREVTYSKILLSVDFTFTNFCCLIVATGEPFCFRQKNNAKCFKYFKKIKGFKGICFLAKLFLLVLYIRPFLPCAAPGVGY